MKGKVMKVYKRSLVAILLALTMIFGSFSFAFGASGTQLGSMTKVTALPGYNSILVKWSPVKNAQKYEIVVKDSKGGQRNMVRTGTSLKDTGAKSPKVTYTYYVRALRDDNNHRTYSNVKSANTQIVRQMYETIYLKSSYRLESHGGGSDVTRTFSSSKPLLATGFGGGKFKFYDGSGSNRRLFYVHVSKVRKARGDYFGKTNYSMAAAENFVNDLVNDRGIKKSKKSDYLIWVSTNTQHIYFFRYNWDKRKWQIPKIKVNGKYVNGHWEVSTGAPDTPTMINMNLKIQFKERSYSGISWWNCFSGYNAIHGKRQSYVIDGHPHSHGCVRNYNNLAEWIYKNCPVGTPVVIF